MFSRISPTYKGILLALLGYSCFSFADVGSKWLALHYPIYQVIALENICSLMVLLIFSSWLGGVKSLWGDGIKRDRPFHLLRGVLNFGINVLMVYSFTKLPLTAIYTAVFTIPFFATLLAIPFYKEYVGPKRWLSIVIGFSGVLVAFRPWENFIPLPLTGLLIALSLIISAMFLVSRSIKHSSPLALAFWPILISGSAMIILALTDFVPVVPVHLFIFVLSGAFVACAIASLSVAFQIADSAVVSPMIYVQMLWGVIFGMIFFGDLPDIWMMVGAAIIIGSGLYLIIHEHHGASSPSTPAAF